MKPFQVKDFWDTYRSRKFKRELKKRFSKIQSYSTFETLHANFSYHNSALILNRSSVFVCKALKIYKTYKQSLEPIRPIPSTQVACLLIRIPKYENLYKILREANLKLVDLLDLERFWHLSLKGLGSKNLAYLYYCLERYNIRIENCKWVFV